MLMGYRPSVPGIFAQARKCTVFQPSDLLFAKSVTSCSAIGGYAIRCFSNIPPMGNIVSNIVRFMRTRFIFCEQRAKLTASSAISLRKSLVVCAKLHKPICNFMQNINALYSACGRLKSIHKLWFVRV